MGESGRDQIDPHVGVGRPDNGNGDSAGTIAIDLRPQPLRQIRGQLQAKDVFEPDQGIATSGEERSDRRVGQRGQLDADRRGARMAMVPAMKDVVP